MIKLNLTNLVNYSLNISIIITILEKSLESQYKSIAVVDDEKDVIFLFTTILRENSYHVMGVYSTSYCN